MPRPSRARAGGRQPAPDVTRVVGRPRPAPHVPSLPLAPAAAARSIGTITLLVTRSDDETGRYRLQLAALKNYGATHAIPKARAGGEGGGGAGGGERGPAAPAARRRCAARWCVAGMRGARAPQRAGRVLHPHHWLCSPPSRPPPPLPLVQDLQSAMRGHLRLHYSAREASDEQVLGAMPSALRRRVLRHMYLGGGRGGGHCGGDAAGEGGSARDAPGRGACRAASPRGERCCCTLWVGSA